MTVFLGSSGNDTSRQNRKWCVDGQLLQMQLALNDSQ